MNIEIITSFNKKYFNHIGKDCVLSWLKFWPKELSLTCYVEEFSMPVTDRINQVSFDNLPEEYFKFQESNEIDRVKIFAKKAYSIIHALTNTNADRVIWIDADVISTDYIPMELLINICNNEQLATYMQVYHMENDTEYVSAETGFFVINTKHELFNKFLNRYTEYYNNRITENLRRFYDGEVFGAVINELITKDNCKVNDLCSSLKKKYKSPLRHTQLAPYIFHYKAKHSKDNYKT